MYLSEDLQKKWSPVLEHPDLPTIKDSYRKAVTAVLLENQETAIAESGSGMLFEAAPANQTGSSIDNYDPVLISLVRRAMPQLIAYDVCGVQPMTGPTGLIFAMKSRYSTQAGTEALFNEADSSFTGSGTHSANGNPAAASSSSTAFTAGAGTATATGEALGDSASNAFAEMAFSIDKVTVTAKTRALKGEYTMEMAQDLKAIHGLDAETELANILSSEVLSEINREVIRTIYNNATTGADTNVATAGTFDMDVDSNGRWMVEKFKGLMFQIEREANAIGKATRRGKGNILLTSSDIASALQMAGILDYSPGLSGNNLQSDDTSNTFAGVLNGRYRVYVDPYATTQANNWFVVGYKGSNAYDAGLFYCPYVPLQMVRAVGENNFQPKIGFKTRYGMVSNPFANSGGTGALTYNSNIYYTRVLVSNLM
jgi:hypothetical protein